MNYKNFFDACKKNLYFETKKGTINIYDLFQLSISDLTAIYRDLKQKAVVDDDPILSETSPTYSDDLLRFEIVRDIILYKKDIAKRNELLAKKRQLEKMLEEARFKKLQEDPSELIKEIEKIKEQLSDTE